MNLDQFILESRGFVSEIEKELPNLLSEVAVNANSLIQLRVQETGINASGTKLGDYSDGVYKSTRSDRGLPTNFVNLTFTGRMWSNIDIISVKSQGGTAKVQVGASIEENEDKLSFNSVRYEDEILEVSESEEEELDIVMDAGVQQIADKFFK